VINPQSHKLRVFYLSNLSKPADSHTPNPNPTLVQPYPNPNPL
jgi:hypothetical protein